MVLEINSKIYEMLEILKKKNTQLKNVTIMFIIHCV